MSNQPILSVKISDFRRLEGTRTLPLDAPIVLIHGANGAGKTSVLSALELGLTGQIRSLRRQDPRYTAHLPTLGQDFATVGVEVGDAFSRNAGPTAPLTAGGSRIEGTPALTPDAANFYGERCYLDQASLGRLLELYQHREGKQESALAKFVNELLGLEQLDALRTGLSPANDIRTLKKLADRLADASTQLELAESDLSKTTRDLAAARADTDKAREAARGAARSLNLDLSGDSSAEGRVGLTDAQFDERLVRAIRLAIVEQNLDTERTKLLALQRELIVLGGRLDAVAARPSAHDLRGARDQLIESTRQLELCRRDEGSKIDAWRRDALVAGVDVDADPGAGIDQAVNDLRRRILSQEMLRSQLQSAERRLDRDRQRLGTLEDRLRDAQEHATALVEGLASIRPAVTSDICPVCDRDYAELRLGHLSNHLDAKMTQLSRQGQRLLDLQQERTEIRAAITQTLTELETATAAIVTPPQALELDRRAVELERLHRAWQLLRAAVETGRGLRTLEVQARRSVEELETASSEEQFARAELARFATTLGTSVPDAGTVQAWEALSAVVASRLNEVKVQEVKQRDGSSAVEQMEQALRRQAEAVTRVADAAQRKSEWDACMQEGRRRQAVARTVSKATAEVKAEVVQRVFTQSLNSVWTKIFSRLAPNEGFIPSFGIPNSSKTGLDLTLRTVHREGREGGSPQMMLSAGNLNTAALSLFLALHLAVQPVIPCLVFDDPVQAMDEVHVAQFAALIRVLARQHERQIIIAVHERELFDYLALELSPAYAGDELLTIELGDQALDHNRGITRHVWTQDTAIA